MAKCPGITRSGEACRGFVRPGDTYYCVAHDSARSEQRKAAASKAGRAKHTAEFKEVKAQLRQLANDVLDGRQDRSRASVVAQVLGIWAKEIIEDLGSYTELSPSETGVHILIKADLPPGGRRKGQIEMYDSGRFFTMTGRHLPGTPKVIKECQAKVEALHRKLFGETVGDTNGHKLPGPGNDLSDTKVVARASQASNGEAFNKLWTGDTSDYTSRSEADLALCSHLAFWTGGEPDRVDRLFRQSALYRPKWDERHFSDGRTYGETTIVKAFEGATEFYVTADDSEWEDPVPLPEGLPPVASLDPAMIPGPLQG